MSDALDNLAWQWYLDGYPDLRQNGINTREAAQQHWIAFGKTERRKFRYLSQEQRAMIRAYIQLRKGWFWEDAFDEEKIIPCASLLSRERAVPMGDYLAICAIVKNEARYLREWIEFHKIVGVNRFYLYDNASTDDTRQLLEPYVIAGEVVLTDWPMHPGQMQAYDHCLHHYSDRARWIAFIDVDEFLFGTYEDDLRSILKDYEGFCGVLVNWLVFGSSGHVAAPAGPVTANFTWRGAEDCKINKHVKSIVDPAVTLRSVGNPHAFVYHDSRCPVNEAKIPLSPSQHNEYGAFSLPSVSRFRINHYATKSREECEQRRLKGRAAKKELKSVDYFEAHDFKFEQDLTIQRFLPLLKCKLSGFI